MELALEQQDVIIGPILRCLWWQGHYWGRTEQRRRGWGRYAVAAAMSANKGCKEAWEIPCVHTHSLRWA